MRAMLIGSAGPLAGREFNLDAPVITVGRRDENDIVIKDPTVSRKHAEIRQEGDDLILRDNGSTSGTMVNGAPLTGEHRLGDGDIIVIGSSATFTVQMHPDDSATVAFSRDMFSAPPAPGAGAGRVELAAWNEPPTPSQPEPGSAAYGAAGRERSEPPVAPRWEDAPAGPSHAPADRQWGGPPTQPGEELPAAPHWATQSPPAPEAPAPEWGAPPPHVSEPPAPAGWGPAPQASAPSTPQGDWGSPPVGQLNLPPDQGAGHTMTGGPSFGPPPRNEAAAPPAFNTPPPGISGPPPGFGAPPSAMPGQAPQHSFGPGPGPQGAHPAFAPPPGPGGPGLGGMMPPQPPRAPARKRGRGPLIAVLLILVLIVIIAVVVAVLILMNRSTTDAIVPLATDAAPVARALLASVL